MPEGADSPRSASLQERTAGYCVLCDRIVERDDGHGCVAGHPPECVTGRIRLGAGEAPPALPRFNWAAFALPPVWGIAHGQWAGLFFLPIWLFADSSVASAGLNALTTAVAVVLVAATLAFQAHFAKRANGLAFRRVADTVTVEEFSRRQRTWALWCVPLGLVLASTAVVYRLSEMAG